MTKNDQPGKYWVKLVRPVFETMTVEVTSTSEEGALAEALAIGESAPDKDWGGSFDPSSYHISAVGVAGEDELEDPQDYLEDREEYQSYMLLMADRSSGEGEIRLQPWMMRASDCSLVDVLGDWIGELTTLHDKGVHAYGRWLQVEAKRGSHDPVSAILSFPFTRGGGSPEK